jgi:RNA polymerase sigma factor (sigma-70 family)
MSQPRATIVLAAVERSRKRLWAHCYRMTGRRAEADDLSQEAIARAIERSDDLEEGAAAEGWLFRIATTACLDHARKTRRARGATELVDPVAFDGLAEAPGGPESSLLLREDVRLAIVAALQRLPPKQRAALLLHDVCGASLAEVAGTLGTNANAAKATLHRARAGLERTRGDAGVDVPVDASVVERLARALEDRSVDALAALLADDVWGVVDGGGVVPAASRPTVGARALLRRFANLSARVAGAVTCRVVELNSEPSILVTLPGAGDAVFASVHVETRGGCIVAMRVVRDPAKLAPLQPAMHRRES